MNAFQFVKGPIEGIQLVKVGPHIVEEWSAVCGDNAAWSTRPFGEYAKEFKNAWADNHAWCWAADEPYSRFWVRCIDVAQMPVRNDTAGLEFYFPFVDLTDRGGVHHLFVGGPALWSVAEFMRAISPGEITDPIEVQVYYPCPSRNLQHVGFRSLRDVRQPEQENNPWRH